MFRALLAHPQEAIRKRHLVCCVRVLVGCGMVAVKLHRANLYLVCILVSHPGSQSVLGLLPG
jgi:hypothetical protein